MECLYQKHRYQRASIYKYLFRKKAKDALFQLAQA